MHYKVLCMHCENFNCTSIWHTACHVARYNMKSNGAEFMNHSDLWNGCASIHILQCGPSRIMHWAGHSAELEKSVGVIRVAHGLKKSRTIDKLRFWVLNIHEQRVPNASIPGYINVGWVHAARGRAKRGGSAIKTCWGKVYALIDICEKTENR